MKNLLGLVAAMIVCCNTFASDSTFTYRHKNSFYAELGGKGPRYSINYERIFRHGKNLVYTYSAGVSRYHSDLSIPVSVTAFTQHGQHHAEFGLGITTYIEKYKYLFKKGDIADKEVYIFPMFGYRYQKPSGRWLFKTGLSPYLFLDPSSEKFWNFTPTVTMGAYMALGVCF